LLIIDIDSVGSLICFKLEALELLSVSLSFGEGDFFDLLSEFTKFLFLRVDEVNL
jgi:hypothetical protein